MNEALDALNGKVVTLSGKMRGAERKMVRCGGGTPRRGELNRRRSLTPPIPARERCILPFNLLFTRPTPAAATAATAAVAATGAGTTSRGRWLSRGDAREAGRPPPLLALPARSRGAPYASEMASIPPARSEREVPSHSTASSPHSCPTCEITALCADGALRSLAESSE